MSDSRLGNEDFAWAEFDSEAYFQHYYGDPHPDDERLISSVCSALRSAAPAGSDLNIVDVGTGPNLFPLFCALPRAATITAWEYSTSNVAWLKSEIERSPLRPQWQHFWAIVRQAYSGGEELPDDPLHLLRKKLEIHRGSVFDLPERTWDVATMFFCAESITADTDQFKSACNRFARSVRPGGMLIGAFLVGSSGYAVSERPFPVLNISERDIKDVFGPLTSSRATEPIGIVTREIRSGYSGMVLLTAVAR